MINVVSHPPSIPPPHPLIHTCRIAGNKIGLECLPQLFCLPTFLSVAQERQRLIGEVLYIWEPSSVQELGMFLVYHRSEVLFVLEQAANNAFSPQAEFNKVAGVIYVIIRDD